MATADRSLARQTEESGKVDAVGAKSARAGLSGADFTRIAANGFGDAENSYVYSMAYFGDQIYAGTLRNALPLLKLYPPLDAPTMEPWPVKTVERVEDLDLRAQIWRFDPKDGTWANALTSPIIVGPKGQEAPRDLGYRGMAVFQGRSDAAPALYVSTVSTVLRGTAARILRSEDGARYEPVSEPGLGNPNISTFRSLIAFRDHLYVAPAGEGTTWNVARKPIVLRSADPVAGEWEPINVPGFGDLSNTGIFELGIFDDHLYAGTFNHYEGFQLWKTAATGRAPCEWTKVLGRGAFRGNLNETVMGMCAFNGALYIGTGIQNGGYDRQNLVGPAAGELIRVYPDDSWDLIVGSPRRTDDGMKVPVSGMGPGFDHLFAGYIWRMTVHGGWLYVSTFDWSMFLPYAQRLLPAIKRMGRELGVDEIVRQAGFQLWRSQDGNHWIPVTRSGFGNPYNHGGRTLVSTPHGLFVGTANPFGPEVAAKLSTRWVYVPNPDGGAEVWLGRAAQPSTLAAGEARLLTESIRRVGTDGAGTRGSSDRRNGEIVPLPSEAAPGRGANQRANPRANPRAQVGAPVLVTGVPGFLGSHLLARLLAQEGRVRLFALAGTRDELRRLREREQDGGSAEVVFGDLNESAHLAEALEGVTTVYHLAGLLPGKPYAELMNVNAQGTENLLRACGEAGSVRRFVFTSSVAVYGAATQRDEWPFSEVSPLDPRGNDRVRFYGLSKVAAEKSVRRLGDEFGFETVILRPSTVYGPGNKQTEALVRGVLANPWAGYGPAGNVMMQPVFVQDLCEVIVRAGSQPEAANQVFNVAGIEVFTYRNLARLIRRLGGMTSWESFVPDRSGIWRRFRRIYDVSKAETVLGFRPRVTVHEGMAEMVEAVVVQGNEQV